MAYTSQTRLLGLNSGMDTESLVTQLMNAESMKLNKLYRNNQTITWKQEAYRGIYDSLKLFQNSFLDFTNMATNMRSATMYKGYTSTVQTRAGVDFRGVTVSTGEKAKAGTYKVKVSQLAQKDIYKSAGSMGGKIEGELDLEELKDSKGGSFTVTLDGTAKTISFSEEEMAAFVDAGVDVGFDTEAFEASLNNKLKDAFGTEQYDKNKPPNNKLTAKLEGGSLKISTTQGHVFKLDEIEEGTMLKTLGIESGTSSELDMNNTKVGDVFKFAEFADGTDSIGISVNNTKITLTSGMTLSEMMSRINDSGANVKLSYDKAAQSFSLEANKSGQANAIKFDNNALKFFSDGLKLFEVERGYGSSTLNAADQASTNFNLKDIFATNSSVTISINSKLITLTNDMSLEDIEDEINRSGSGVTLNKSDGKYSLEPESGKSIMLDDNAAKLLNDGFGFSNLPAYNENIAIKDTRDDAHKAQDSIYTYNGVTTSRDSNIITIEEGITLTLTDTTLKEAKEGEIINEDDNYITITVKQDTDKSIDNIKKFIEAYNALIDGINGQSNASRPKSGKYTYYDPLLDEEKAGMSESQIEKWEEQAKTGLLYRDSILSGITSEMRTMLYKSVELDGNRKISLYEIGITTSSKTSEGGKLVIDEDKLRKALEERPDDVTELFTKRSENTDRNARMNEEGLADRLDDIIKKYVASDGPIGSKAGIKGSWTESNNMLYREMTNNSNKIDDMLSKLAKKEEYYYNMFAKMESAMAQANSQANYLGQMIGA